MPDVDSTTWGFVVVWSSFTVSQNLRLHFHDPQLYSGYLFKPSAQNDVLFRNGFRNPHREIGHFRYIDILTWLRKLGE